MASLEPFNRVVRLTARAFYDDIPIRADNQLKNSRGDNRGVAVVVLDALARSRQPWVREADLAKALKLHSKQLRRVLRLLEEDKLVMRNHRKESTKERREKNAASSDVQPVITKEAEEKTKLHTHSYCCLDYAQICDVVRYRIHRMKKKLKDELDSRNTIQQYICPSCNKMYSAFDALQLVSYTDEYFHCESCNGELVAESDKLACVEMGDCDDNARKCRREKMKDMLQRVDEQLKPLVIQLDRVKNLPVPEFGSLQSWEISNIGASVNGGLGAADSSMNSQGVGTAMLMGKPEVVVKIADGAKEVECSKNGTELKVLPPWLNLEKKQRGETSIKTVKLDETTEDKDGKSQGSKDEKSIQEEYVKAYYEALRKTQEEEAAKRRMQEEGEKFLSDFQSKRHVGKKYRWEDEGIVWEDEQPAGNTSKMYKLDDFNFDAQESADGEDDIVWEEG